MRIRQIKLIEEHSPAFLQREVNTFLNGIGDTNIIDIEIQELGMKSSYLAIIQYHFVKP